MTLLFLTDMSVTRCLCHDENSWKHFTVLVKEIDAFLSDNENDRAEELLWLFYRDDVKAIEYVEVQHPLLKELIANPTREKTLEIIKQLKIIEINEIAETIKDNKYCWIDKINYRIY